MENRITRHRARRRNRQGFRVTGRWVVVTLCRSMLNVSLVEEDVVEDEREDVAEEDVIKGGRRGFRMPRGRWMFVLFERHVEECVFS